MKISLLTSFACIALLAVAGGCAVEPRSTQARADLHGETHATINRFTSKLPALTQQMRSAAGYAIFPNVTKGALIAGGAEGWGELYEKGTLTGYCRVVQVTVGGQIGAQAIDEIIILQSPAAVTRLKTGKLSLSVNLSASALDRTTRIHTDTGEDYIIHSKPLQGLMAEAAVGTQTFTFYEK